MIVPESVEYGKKFDHINPFHVFPVVIQHSAVRLQNFISSKKARKGKV